MVSMMSDKGVVRSLNEDYAEYLETKEFNIYVVADGMGGHNAGEVASKMAAQGIVEYIKDNFRYFDNEEVLKKAIYKVNSDIYRFSKENEKLNGMGTTVTACLQVGKKVIVANVGDSSSYVLKGNELQKITKDHSLVQELVDLGTITEVQAANHPKKNIITRAVGTNEHVEVDIFTIYKDEYDVFLICSDGLTNEVSKEDIISAIIIRKSLDESCERLIHLAKKNGGRDNITVLLFGGEE